MMSVIKLLSRIVAPSELEEDQDGCVSAAKLHDYTYGITSDPLTQFGCAYSALIHDVGKYSRCCFVMCCPNLKHLSKVTDSRLTCLSCLF